MQAIIFADRDGHELAPLCEKDCPALLPVANKPVLQYAVEDLASAGIDDILVVVSDNILGLRERFDKGEAWGVKVRYLLSRGEENPEELLSRYESLLKPPFIAMRGDIFRAQVCAEFISKAQQFEASVVGARINGRNAGICLAKQWPARLPDLVWPQLPAENDKSATLELGDRLLAPLDSLVDFHRASLALLQSHPADTRMPGRIVENGLTVGRLSQVSLTSLISSPAMVGDHTMVHESTELKGPCVIGHQCYVSRGVSIKNSVILSGTYIGENLHLENTIAAGNRLIRVDTGCHIAVSDPLMLSALNRESDYLLRRLPESALGLGILLLSLPLWPVAFVISALRFPKAILTRFPVVSNCYRSDTNNKHRKAVCGLRFSTSVPILRSLPMLWLVVKGDLNLFGSAPLLPERLASPFPSWDIRAQSPSSGLIGPAQLKLSPNAPEEEVRLNEAEFVSHTGISAFLARTGKSIALLFSAQAWRPSDHHD